MKFYFYIFLLNLFFIATFCCEQHKTCRECIRDENKCVWCADEKYKEGIRCKSKVGLGNWCSDHIENPKSLKPNATRADEFSSEKGRIVQLKPQKIELHLRPGQSIDFDFTYKRASNYPLDFYFLMDGSLSMRKYTERTANQSMAMYDMLHNMTNDVSVGIGSFIDKNAIPYTNNVEKKIAYSFKNILKLNGDYEKFQSALKNMKFGVNFDEPEGIMDALAQVMACKDEIGWREQSRKIIVLNTDASYHVAGHGIWAGIIQPYDGNCYTENCIYTKELEMDYPSISILKTMALREGFIIIFVVDLDKKYAYIPLIEEMGARVTFYGAKAQNVNEILSDIYNNISESIRLINQIESAYRDYFEITFEPDCNKEYCLVNINEEKKFVGTIKLLKYLDIERIPINVAIDGLNEKLRLDVNIIKECKCEPELKSSYCNLNGSKTCGICECDPGWHGESCQCSAFGGLDTDKKRCMANGIECSSRGVCECGKCKCIDNFKGEFCECNLQNCVRGSNGKLCSGHGSCGEIKCGQCRCDDDWTGDDCSCSKLQTNCEEDGKEICSGFGDCVCNECTCRPLAPWDIRSRDHLCHPVQSETPDEGQQLQCVQLQACVLKFLNERKSGCEHVNITAVDTLEINNSVEETLLPENIIDNINNNAEESIEQDNVVESQEQYIMSVKTQELSNIFWIECPEIRADVGCYTKFVYKYDENTYGIHIKVQTKLNCAETYYTVGGGCLIGLVLIGLVTLVCWKILTNRRDRAEYDRFFKEVQSENPELINPIFAPATVSFNNPAFRRSRPES